VRTGDFARTWGGGTLITAVAAARLGTEVIVVSALPDGAVDYLTREAIEVRNLLKRGEPHALSVALSTADERAFATYDGVNEDLERRLLVAFERRLPRARHVHFALGARQLDAWARVAKRLRARGTTTSWDFGWHDGLMRRRGFARLIGELDWVLVNEKEARAYARARRQADVVARWRAMSRATVIKRGSRGALAILRDTLHRVEAPTVKVVDTTGAGDAFNGGFLAALVRDCDIVTCLHAGVMTGSLSTRRAGGIEGLPARAELKIANLQSSMERRP
jgi:sugar/nucleoside kinase (ribokinase family)